MRVQSVPRTAGFYPEISILCHKRVRESRTQRSSLGPRRIDAAGSLVEGLVPRDICWLIISIYTSFLGGRIPWPERRPHKASRSLFRPWDILKLYRLNESTRIWKSHAVFLFEEKSPGLVTGHIEAFKVLMNHLFVRVTISHTSLVFNCPRLDYYIKLMRHPSPPFPLLLFLF